MGNTLVFFFCEALAQLGAERLGGPTDPPPSYTVDAVKSRTQARVNVVRPPSPPSSSCGKLYNYILSDIFFSDVIRSGEPNASKHRVSAAVARWLRGSQDRDGKRLRRIRGTAATTSQPVDLQAPPDVDEGQQARELPFTEFWETGLSFIQNELIHSMSYLCSDLNGIYCQRYHCFHDTM